MDRGEGAEGPGDGKSRLHADDAVFLKLLSNLLDDEVRDKETYSARDVSRIVNLLQDRVGAHLIAVRNGVDSSKNEGTSHGKASRGEPAAEHESPRMASL